MKAADWIDRVKSAKGWESDYRVSKELKIRAQTVSNYRSSDGTMDDEIAVKVAQALGAPPEAVLIDQAIERTKSDEARSALAGLMKRLGWAAEAPAAKSSKPKRLYIMLTKTDGPMGAIQAMAQALAPGMRAAMA